MAVKLERREVNRHFCIPLVLLVLAGCKWLPSSTIDVPPVYAPMFGDNVLIVGCITYSKRDIFVVTFSQFMPLIEISICENPTPSGARGATQ